MRIGFVTGEYPPMEGGVGAFTRELGRAMSAAGHQIFVHTRQQATAHAEDDIQVDALVRKWGWRTPGNVRDWARDRHLDVVNLQFQTAAFGR